MDDMVPRDHRRDVTISAAPGPGLVLVPLEETLGDDRMIDTMAEGLGSATIVGRHLRPGVEQVVTMVVEEAETMIAVVVAVVIGVVTKVVAMVVEVEEVMIEIGGTVVVVVGVDKV